MMTPKDAFSMFIPIPDTEWDLVDDLFTLRDFKKGDTLESEGERSYQFGIIIEGILRGYYLLGSGREKTKAFRYSGTFFANYHSLLTKEPSRFTVEAITKGRAWFSSYSDFNLRIEKSLFWQTLLKNLNAHEYLLKEQREYELLSHTAEQRYQSFLRDYHGIADKIPQYHIANYLGVDPSSLNRLIKKMS
jgi:CRP-like cAMP-binding protein